MDDAVQRQGLKGFFDKGGFWRLLVVVLVYLAIYLGASKLPSVFGWGKGNLLDGIPNIFAQLTFALIVGAVVLAAFTAWLGWNGELYGRQRIYRSGWMWLAPILVVAPILMRVGGISWGARPVSIAAFVIVSGLFVGFVEELLCRGIAVKMLRTAGHKELAVAALSSLTFALLHAANLLSGQALASTALQIFYTFGFGVLMYLTLRTTRFLVIAMVLHGLTDPMGILASGGIGDNATEKDVNVLLQLAGDWLFVVGFGGLILLFFVRGVYGQLSKHGGPDAAVVSA